MRPLQVIERDDDASEGKRQPEDEQKQEHARAGDSQVTDGERRHRRDDQRNRHHGKHDECARAKERGHVRHVEGFDEVAPLRVCGPFEPVGHRSRWMQRGREDADEGQDRDRHQPDEERTPGPEFAATNLHACSLPAQALDGDDDDQDQNHEHDRQSRRQANPLLGEGKDVDLDSGYRRRVAGSARRRDVDDVKGGKRGDHRDGEAYADLIPEQRDGDPDELREPARAVDPRRLVERRVELRHAGPQQDGAESQQDPDSDEADGRERPVEVAEPGTGDRAKTDGLEDLVDQARKRQQPTPDDPGRNERDDLRQEQHGPGDRAEPPGRHAVDDAGDDKPERHRDEAEEHDQPERIEDGSEQIRNFQDGRRSS